MHRLIAKWNIAVTGLVVLAVCGATLACTPRVIEIWRATPRCPRWRSSGVLETSTPAVPCPA
jgi:hypothetical protein